MRLLLSLSVCILEWSSNGVQALHGGVAVVDHLRNSRFKSKYGYRLEVFLFIRMIQDISLPLSSPKSVAVAFQLSSYPPMFSFVHL
jgi:hypothetical protein